MNNKSNEQSHVGAIHTCSQNVVVGNKTKMKKKIIIKTHSAKHLTIKSGVVVSGRSGGLRMCAAA